MEIDKGIGSYKVRAFPWIDGFQFLIGRLETFLPLLAHLFVYGVSIPYR